MKVHFVFVPTLKKFCLGELSEGRVPPLSLFSVRVQYEKYTGKDV